MFAQPAAATNQGIISQYTVTSFHACTSKGTVSKTGNRNVRPVLQYSCKTSWVAMLPVLLLVCEKSGCCRLRKVVAKVESSSTFRSKICTCYAFSRPTTNLFCNYSCVRQHLFLKWKVVEIMWRHTFFLLDTRNGERSPLASGNLSDEKKEVLMKQLRFVSECHRFYIIILFVCFKIVLQS